ncbi:hypothetical protein RHGRI_031218 [Rhododendron griersonianum]|uniref:Glycoside hydrolase family 31 N-terminal domain-containing protein n=1 Tax=Rhododendron griersonianum TaxID=479676 RepID=A0AAV6ICW1_9ERIC|nr:hypothetical protein RHGRI_031218 [Rhododendron griersonianum]
MEGTPLLGSSTSRAGGASGVFPRNHQIHDRSVSLFCSCSGFCNSPLKELVELKNLKSTKTFTLFHSIRKKRINKRLVVSNMAELEATAVTSDMESGNMVFEPILEEGVFRFDCSPDHRNAALPSVSFVNSKDRDTPMMGSQQVPSYTPTFECVHGQQIVQLELPIGTSFYGTGEVSGQLERTGKRVFTWNTDAWGYGPGTTSLYQSHPWVLAVLPSGEALGVLGDTTRRCEIDLRKESTIKFIAPSPYPVITFGPYASPTDVLISLSHAVGNLVERLIVVPLDVQYKLFECIF